MSFDLVDRAGARFGVNAWNWGVLHALVADAELFPIEDWAGARYNGGAELDEAQVRTLLAFLRDVVLPSMQGRQRLLADGSFSDLPDDGTFHRAPGELSRNYSLDRDVVIGIIAFLEASRGPVAVC